MASGEGAGRTLQRWRREALGPACHDKAGHAAENVRRRLKDRLRHGNDEAGREALGVARLPVVVMRGAGRMARIMIVVVPFRHGGLTPGAGLGRHERVQPCRHQKHQHDKQRPETDQSHFPKMGARRRLRNPFRGAWFHKSCLADENRLGFATTDG